MTKPKKRSTVGMRIGQARAAYRISQSQLGAMLKVTRAAISQYEQDKIRPRDEVIERLAEVFGASAEWFVTGRGAQPAPVDLPITVPEIEVAQITPKVADLSRLATERQWNLPPGALGCAITPDHMVAFVAPNDAGSILAGDRVVVDLQSRTGPGVFLVVTDAGAQLIRDVADGHADTLGRVVAYLRAI